MNKTNLKRYAPQARKDFIAAVTARAQLLGLSEVAGKPYAELCEVNGDVAVIAGRAWPASVQGKRDRLLQRMKRDGYTVTLDAVAYTWFNRFAALRYMELHDYLGHGRRVLSNPDGALPEVLSHALELAEAGDLPGLQAEQVRQLKLDNQDGELFRRVLIAQCNALHGAMPFLFEAIDDETELLLPDNLLLSDSVVAKLVSEIPEEDWTEVEAIGWLYQFYISEKKDEVIGKVVKSEDIPAATQLFTPNWIVQYLVQNSVGRLWLMANPASTLVSQWPYYIQPAAQTPEVQAQLNALIQTRIREDGEALNPETITVLDPACGSGHILVVAYDVLKAIYLERGYQPRAIPRLILEKNLYGLDIDDRAAQLASFALLMKARADDRRLLSDPPKLNVLSLQESKGLDVDELTMHLAPFGLQRTLLKTLVDTFEHAKTFGSLIHVPDVLKGQMATMTAFLQEALRAGDLYAQQAAKDIVPLLRQAQLLGMHFDAMVANPPYMGTKGMSPALKAYAKTTFPDSKSDLFAMFMGRGFDWCKPSGFNSLITMQSWMFLSSYEAMREKLLRQRTFQTMAHLGARAFAEISGEVVQTTAFVLQCHHISGYKPVFFRLVDGQDFEKAMVLRANQNRFDANVQDDFCKIPGSPVAYWLSPSMKRAFQLGMPIEEVSRPVVGLQTGENAKFVRYWHEVSISRVGFSFKTREHALVSKARWFPYNKGGDFQRWYGNQEFVVDWEHDGERIRSFVDESGKLRSRPQNLDFYFRPSVSWSKISSGLPAFRFFPDGFIFDVAGTSIFSDDAALQMGLLGFANSVVAQRMLEAVSPTLNFEVGHICSLPYVAPLGDVAGNVKSLIEIASQNWNAFEVSWDYRSDPLVGSKINNSHLTNSQTYSIETTLKSAWVSYKESVIASAARMRKLEIKNNLIFINAYGLQDELTPDVPEEQITLVRADREKDCQRLISYAIGCMMGRYSLDEPGLIYARAGNVGFEPGRYPTFPADADGIVPITNERWFQDDAPSRVREFLRAVWGIDKLDENMAWLAESLGTKGTETPDETVRRYLADKFYKDHLQTYKKRPIYWLFSSGKQGAFKALVYLHRYHEGTLARMRSEYVLPLTGKMQARMESLEVDIRQASSTAARNKLTKQLDALRKQHHELLAYDEKLRHYADQRISIDLDDGVKVNYGKFGDLLSEVKAVTGGAGDE